MGKEKAKKKNQYFMIHLHENIKALTDARGLGVGRRPPPGIIPATALAGASSDIALDSSGMTPRGKTENISVHVPRRRRQHSDKTCRQATSV